MHIRTWPLTLAGLAACLAAQPAAAQNSLRLLVQPTEPPAVADSPQVPEPGRPWIGVRLSNLEPALRSQLGLEGTEGWLVAEVYPDTPAAGAGVKPYDVIVSAAGKPLPGAEELSKIVKEADGKPVAIELIRAGKRETIEVTPKPAPSPPEPKTLGVTLFGLAQSDFLKTDLPDDVEVEIRKKGKEAAGITVRRGRMNWEMIPGDNLDRLPEDVRGPVAKFLGHAGATAEGHLAGAWTRSIAGTVHAHAPDVNVLRWEVAPIAPPAAPAAPQAIPPIEKRLDDIARRLDAIEKSLSEQK